MSIKNSDGETIVQLSTIWEWGFKLLLLSVPAFLGLLFSWGVWITLLVIDHDREMAVINAVIK